MGDCFKSTGKTITEVRQVNSFNRISVDDGINVFIRQDNHYSLSVKGGKNIIDMVETDVSGQSLNIRNKNKCNWVRSFKRSIDVYVSVIELREIDYAGHGDIIFQNQINADNFYLNMNNASGSVQANLNSNYVELKVHSGPADIIAQGLCDEVVIFNAGNGNIDALALASNHSLSINRNTGKVFVNASQSLKAEIYESGSIFYRGSPSIELLDQGSGNLNPI